MTELSSYLKKHRADILFWSILLAWFVIDMLQAVFTEVHPDEAYYALYGEYPAWGYYDHPPMVGLWVFLSGKLFGGALGLRFLTCLMHVGTVFLTYKLTEAGKSFQKTAIFLIVSTTLVMFSVYGFVTTPDAPLLFFTAALLLCYKHYLKNPEWGTALLLGVLMAASVYSKYHAVLVIGFIVLANPRLLADKKFWVACILALVLFLPHILWQVQSDFPSFKYHLVQRSQTFSWKFPLEYIPNQLAVFNPVSFFIALWFCFKFRKNLSVMERTYSFLFIGFLVFFWIMTLRGHTEPHWTVAASIPMIAILTRHLSTSSSSRKIAFYAILPTLALILAARILLVASPLSEKFHFKGNEQYAADLQSVAGDLPVVFSGCSFQNVSIYRFYTHTPSILVNSFDFFRRTQFDLLELDKTLQGQPAFLLGEGDGKGTEWKAGRQVFTGYFADHLQTLNSVHVGISDRQIKNDSLYLSVGIENPYPEALLMNHAEFPFTIHIAYGTTDGYELHQATILKGTADLPAGSVSDFILRCELPSSCREQENPRAIVCLRNRICTSANSEVFTY